MSVILEVAKNYVLEQIFKKYPHLRQLYKEHHQGAVRARSEWINTRPDGITIQLMHQERGRVGGSGHVVRFDLTFVESIITVDYHMRKAHSKALNNSIMIHQEADTNDQQTWEETYQYELADPQSLSKVVTLLVEKIKKHI